MKCKYCGSEATGTSIEFFHSGEAQSIIDFAPTCEEHHWDGDPSGANGSRPVIIVRKICNSRIQAIRAVQKWMEW